MANPVSVVNFDFIRNILQYIQVVQADELGEITPFHAEDGQQVEILKIPISQVTGVEQAVQKWNAEFHRPEWWRGDHTENLPWYLL